MIGVPMANPRDAVIDELNRQMDQFFGGGGQIKEIARGVSSFAPHLGTTGHHERLRAERDKLAPSVKAQAEAGKTASEAAKALRMHIKRATLIAKENGFKFADPA
ncbi:hypothetical protein HX866_11295 [Pseudomonas gingeri]|uniref:hypothetical protein n=1 Tax=Pseudomonas gingeri TaxID=117681 RepID=UPI0015A2110B|nr:hypothetical protein [Pseudomonas gingeri]NWA25481.1 hypothetical protein [Pseudomonas gingeri]